MSREKCITPDHGCFEASFSVGQPAIAAGTELPFIGVTDPETIGDYDLPIVLDTPVEPASVFGGTLTFLNGFVGGTSTVTLGTDGLGVRFDIDPCTKKLCIAHIVIPESTVPLLVGLGVLEIGENREEIIMKINPSLTEAGSKSRVVLWFGRK